MSLSDPDNPLAAEIQQETAAAYFAACKRMVTALEALKASGQIEASQIPGDGNHAPRSELFAEAVERVYFVIIQREAMRLTCFEEFFQDYEIPTAVRAGLGVRQRK